ncbi:MAG: hypothetical protein WC466_10160 [Candidatus Izemoplasmatales bacterium]
MSTNYTKHNNKAKRYRKQIEEIQLKYPGINMKSKELLRDINKLHDLFIKVIWEEVDAKQCKSGKPDDMCSDCTCWKHNRMMCS